MEVRDVMLGYRSRSIQLPTLPTTTKPDRRIVLPKIPGSARPTTSGTTNRSRRRSNPSKFFKPVNVRTTPNKVPQRKTRFIIVYGFTCDRFLNDLKERERQLKAIAKTHGTGEVEVHCNIRHSKSMTSDIVKSLAPSKNKIASRTEFVMDILERVCRAMGRGENVVLIGHSYGGSVVSRVALHLQEHCGYLRNKNMLKRLKAITFGSIYAPSKKLTPNVNITHYTYAFDIARVCHDTSYECKVMRPRGGRGPLGQHMDYDHIIEDVVRKGHRWRSGV